MDAFLANAYQVVLQPIIFLLFGCAFVVFSWGLAVFIKNKDSDEGRETGKRTIIWGIVGMFIMASVFGIINVIAGTLGVKVPVDDSQLRKDIDAIDVKTTL
ncbi:MAG TPA: hypothetical protein VJ837_03740 [Candidatus Paceibacterota bacterium]|nr:hypothetical protein [Candidatus Paceibacterota bacterium]